MCMMKCMFYRKFLVVPCRIKFFMQIKSQIKKNKNWQREVEFILWVGWPVLML